MKTLHEILTEGKAAETNLHASLLSHHPKIGGDDEKHLDSYLQRGPNVDGKSTPVHNPKKVNAVVMKHAKPLHTDATLYRGLSKAPHIGEYSGSKPISTTISHQMGSEYAADRSKAVKAKTHQAEAHMLKIHAKKGTKGVYVPGAHGESGSREFILHSDTKIKVHPNPSVHFRDHVREDPISGKKETTTVKHHVWAAEVTQHSKPKKGAGSY